MFLLVISSRAFEDADARTSAIKAATTPLEPSIKVAIRHHQDSVSFANQFVTVTVIVLVVYFICLILKRVLEKIIQISVKNDLELLSFHADEDYQKKGKIYMMKNKSKWIEYIENPQINRLLINSFVLPVSFISKCSKEMEFKTLKEREHIGVNSGGLKKQVPLVPLDFNKRS